MATSPDLRRYLDLSVYDRGPAELVDRALVDATQKLPGWAPREGNTEVVLMEALALTVAELIYATNRLPGAIATVLLRLFGVERSPGVAPSAAVTFTLADLLPHTIPAGTLLRIELGGLEAPLILATAEELVVPAGVGSGTVDVVGLTGTSLANGIPAGTTATVISGTGYVDHAELATSIAGGADPEDDIAWLNRGVERLARLSDSLVLPSHFTSYALEDTRVFRATTIDNLDPDVGPAGANLGHVTVVVTAAGGVNVDTAVLTELEAAMEARSAAMLDVHVVHPAITDVDVTVEVVRLPGYAEADVDADVEAAIRAYVNPDSWPWAATVRRNELIALVDGVEGVDYVVSLTLPAADVALTGIGPLARAGTVTVTVTAP